jgi:hypothetical protein
MTMRHDLVPTILTAMLLSLSCGSGNEPEAPDNQTSDMGNVQSDMPDDVDANDSREDLSSGNAFTGGCQTDEDCTRDDGNYRATPSKDYCVSIVQEGSENMVSFCSECRTDEDCAEEGAICSLNSGRCLSD